MSLLKPIKPGSTPVSAVLSISRQLSQFVAQYDVGQIPIAVRERSKHLILDAVGIALASTYYDFAHRTLSGLTAISGGGSCAIQF